MKSLRHVQLFATPWTTACQASLYFTIWWGEVHKRELRDLNLKLQYFGHLMQRADSFEKTLMLGKIEGRGRRG